VAGGRLDFGIGAGSRPSLPMARREYDSHGLPYHDFPDSVAALDEALTVIRRLWTEAEPFDYDGRHVHLTGGFANPKPVQQPHPPIIIGGRSTPLLRVVARHADLWNIPGGNLEDAVERSATLDRLCTEIGRDPAEIRRSMHLGVSPGELDTTRQAIADALGAGFTHVILGVTPPYPDHVARWLADELIAPAQG
jgi:alkanesulfonate monooxygenase SsuD/methylene tetrahydromethanopterin reductase-like flavin-dependent oxidoreductase (luciferase family)